MRRCTFLLPLLALGCGQPPLEPRDPTPGVFHFRVATYNVEFKDADDEATIAAVGSPEADVLCLQEVTPGWERVLRERYDYEHMLFYLRSETSSSGLAVLSRYPLLDLGLKAGPGGWHPAWHIGVETPEGPMQILNVHLRAVLMGDSEVGAYLSVDDDHLREIEEFSAQCNGGLPTLVVGDFNEEPDGTAIEFLEGKGFTNALPLFHPGQETWRYNSVASQLAKTYDHILFDGRFEPLNAWVDRKGNSDHLPVGAHLEVSPSWYENIAQP